MKKVIALLLMLSMLLCSVAVADTEAAEPSYTYNTAASEFPTNWSPFSNQTATDGDILDYIRNGFYTFDFNDTLDGYCLLYTSFGMSRHVVVDAQAIFSRLCKRTTHQQLRVGEGIHPVLDILHAHILHGYAAVSYTHLDVYKRQVS